MVEVMNGTLIGGAKGMENGDGCFGDASWSG